MNGKLRGLYHTLSNAGNLFIFRVNMFLPEDGTDAEI